MLTGLCWVCHRKMIWTKEKGWVHEENGSAYWTKIGPDGVERDDHCGRVLKDTIRKEPDR